MFIGELGLDYYQFDTSHALVLYQEEFSAASSRELIVKVGLDNIFEGVF